MTTDYYEFNTHTSLSGTEDGPGVYFTNFTQENAGQLVLPGGWSWFGETTYNIQNYAPTFYLNIHTSVNIITFLVIRQEVVLQV
jgi:hypothetical protein